MTSTILSDGQGFMGGFTVNDESKAAFNDRVLRAALARRGKIELLGSGTIWVSARQVIGSNTHLRISDQLTLKQLKNTSGSMLVTEAFATRQDSATVTVAWTSGLQATVTWTGHSLSAGDCIWLRGATQNVYNNVFRVLSVTDANNVVIVLPYLPSVTASGTILAKKCTQNFSVIGGTFHYNYAQNTGAAAGPDRATLVWGVCADFIIERVRSIDGYKFCHHTGACMNGQIRQIYGEGLTTGSSSEALKAYGPQRHMKVIDVDGRCTDDFASVQTKESASFSAYDWTGGGDIFDLEYDGIHGETTGGSMITGLYLSDNETADNISFRRVDGYQANGSGCKVQYGTGYTTGVAGTVSFEKCAPRVETAASQYCINIGANVRLLNIDEPVFKPATLTANFFRQSGNTINTLNVRRPAIDSTTWPSSASLMFVLAGTKVDIINFTGGYNGPKAGQGALLSLSCPFDVCNVSGFDFNGGSAPIVVQSSASSGRRLVNLDGNKFLSTARALRYFAACTVVTKGCVYDTLTECFLGSAAVLLKLYDGGGNVYNSASLYTSASSATVELYGFGFSVDPITLSGLASTVGQYVFSSQAGTEGGPAVLTPAGWVALGTGAAGANTVIT